MDVTYKILLTALGITTAGILFALTQERLVRIEHTPPGARQRLLLPALPATPEPTPAASKLPLSPLTGLPCAQAQRRPFAVMLAADPITRPLSGIGEADLVIEMPVTTNQITRMMAVYQCSTPKELGSIRSARHDFLPLAAGLNAIYVHWGGSRFALDQLRDGILHNIDALVNPFNAFYRKRGIAAPHNGFSDYDRIARATEGLGYGRIISPDPYFSRGPADSIQRGVDQTAITLPYNPSGFAVRWEYDGALKTYKRLRSGTPEMDRNTGAPVHAAVVAVMKTTQRHLEGQYTEMKVVGRGPATIHQYGHAIAATWVKEDHKGKLRFVDEAGNDMLLIPGKIWIEIIASSL